MYYNVTGKLILKFEKDQRLSLRRALIVLTLLKLIFIPQDQFTWFPHCAVMKPVAWSTAVTVVLSTHRPHSMKGNLVLQICIKHEVVSHAVKFIFIQRQQLLEVEWGILMSCTHIIPCCATVGLWWKNWVLLSKCWLDPWVSLKKWLLSQADNVPSTLWHLTGFGHPLFC